jgi:molybdopterin/thiamine biosynthesis adenylyltransferase/rhodanese-related sulfurtransferase
MTNFRDLLKEARAAAGDIDAEELKAKLDAGRRVQILDVREQEETQNGVIPGAATLGRAHFESRVEDTVPDKEAPVVVYCATSVRSAFASKTLIDLGYKDVSVLKGGFERWKDLGLQFDIPRVLNLDQRTRYARHLILKEVGEEGQQKLLDAKILSIGAGGLGSPSLLYLAAAGVGTLGIVDSDVVEASNLQRQIIHNTEKIGVSKAESAKEVLQALNPDVKVETHPFRMDAGNVKELISQYDVIVDGSDNFDTRYVLNDAAVELRKPVIHGSIFRFEGMVSTFVPFEGPCYRCLYPEAPPPELAPNCTEAGVLGVLPGIVGCLEANEAIKLVVGYGESLAGRLLLFDAASTKFSEVKVRRDPSCPVCGDAAAKTTA